ncbi:GntR family transcriptional regulator [Actinospica sp.]|jgi:GntR family transcriptional regulator|uniref:GntR family transcriptional regulator n=1 Tax=Actinospica sp. TaxID=1872142 RepID=UPI002C37930C|nr:GntR family transcriptional regulator [Actinospica sp.]HWG25828.1 GntR family transcriptional regulator [Actinospica sp.]
MTDARLPLWYQVTESLRARILGRAPDEPLRLPTEAQLAAEYAVAVSTVRQALATLETEGLITRRRRHGTFIVPNQAHPPLHVLGTVDTILAQQAGDDVRILRRSPVPTPAALTAHFPGVETLIEFQRLRLQDGDPLSHAENHIRPEHAEKIADEDLRTSPMTKLLRDRAALDLARIDNTVEACPAPPHIAELLQVALAAPVLRSTNVTYDTRGHVVDTAVIHYRADRFQYTVSLDLTGSQQ